ncbi:Membrane protein involved in the export of O-antigen and teichoic acid [Rhodothermus profundi]|uniref:Membrane protein involved in the export of O-antigen and teichoic acid n=2 Tax=Rhodothermus profundi TaxID=633813 RepID=A0A1M6PK25_9BACT|nr:Membrane protein involved in the export of O-antigen and teichoic acid [Rhodothermus profundi]
MKELGKWTSGNLRRAWERGFGQVLGRGIGIGALTGLLSRGVGILVQIFAMPIALHALGVDRFGVFLMLMGLAQWVTLGNFGMSDALTRFVAGGEANDAEKLGDYLGAALTFSLIFGTFLALVCGGIILGWLQSKATLSALPWSEVLEASVILLGLMMVKTITATFQGVQVGRLKSYKVNLFQIVGKLCVIGLLAIAAFAKAGLSGFVAAMVGGLLVGDVLNAYDVMKQVYPRFKNICKKNYIKLKLILKTGLSYSIINFVAFGTTGFLVFLVGALAEPSEAARFGLLMRLWVMITSLLAIINLPVWPAFLDAFRENDWQWLKISIKRLLMLEVSVGLVIAMSIGVGVSQILHLWVGEYFEISSKEAWFFALALFQAIWAYCWGIILMGLQKEKVVAVTHLIRFVIIVTTGIFMIPQMGANGAIVALGGAYFVAETFILPWIGLTALQRRIIKTSGARL